MMQQMNQSAPDAQSVVLSTHRNNGGCISLAMPHIATRRLDILLDNQLDPNVLSIRNLFNSQ